MQLLLLVSLACLAAATAAAATGSAGIPPPELEVPVFRLVDLQAPDEPVLARLREAIYHVGMFAVTGTEETISQPPAAAAALGALVRCAHAPDAFLPDDTLREVRLPDGSRRRTLATETSGSVPQSVPQHAKRCPGFEREASRLRRSVDRTGRAYAAALDVIVHGKQQPSEDVDSFGSAVRDGESLEHFHMFERPLDVRSGDSGPQAPDQRPTPALEMHSDIGLFIIMTTAQYFQQPTRHASNPASNASNAGANTWQHLTARQPRPQPGLFLQLPSGQVVRPVFPDPALLVMNGEGGSKWMRVRPGSAAPAAAAHEVVLPSDMQGMVRGWYGRMYFPLPEAQLQPDPSEPTEAAAAVQPMTFQQYRTQTMAAFVDGQPQRASTAGCSPGRRILQDNGACPAGQLYCWMQCMAIPSSLSCPQASMKCSNSNGLIWPTEFPGGESDHCMDCKVTCPAAQPPVPPLPGPPSPLRSPPPLPQPLATSPPLPTYPPTPAYRRPPTYPSPPAFPPPPTYPPPHH